MASPATPARAEEGQNAEAGPSTPRSYRTPPETPTRSGGSTRRRSWFGFGGLTSVSTPSRDKADPARRLSFEAGSGSELADRHPPRTPTDTRHVDDDAREELTIDAQPAESPRRSKRRSKSAIEDGEVLALQTLSKRSGSIERQRSSKDGRTSGDTIGAEVSSR